MRIVQRTLAKLAHDHMHNNYAIKAQFNSMARKYTAIESHTYHTIHDM